MGLSSPTPQQLLSEAIIFWTIAVVLVAGRLCARVIVHGSIKRLQVDDYVMIVTFCFYTTLFVLIQISARYATNLLDPADISKVLADPKQVRDRIFGSKIVIGLEQCMLASTWGVKICLLLLYHQMTYHLPQNLYVKVVAGYVALGFVVIQITYFGVYCQPFSQYWAFPVSNLQCATYSHYSITQAVFNISSDAMMLLIPVPILLKVQLPRSSKIILVAVFSLGIFVILAAILNKYTNFANPITTTYMIWYIRESSTAIYVANIMCWWPLLRKFFGMRTFSGDSSGRGSGVVPVRKLIRRISNFDGLADSHCKRGGFRGFAQRMRATKLPRITQSMHGKGHQRTDTEAEVSTHCFPHRTSDRISTSVPMSPRGIPLEIWRQVGVEVENRELPSRSSVRCKLFEHISEGRSKYKASVSIRSSPDPCEGAFSRESVLGAKR